MIDFIITFLSHTDTTSQVWLSQGQLLLWIILGILGLILAWIIWCKQIKISKEQQKLSKRQLDMDKRIFEIDTIRYSISEFKLAIDDRQVKCFKMEDTLRNDINISQEIKDWYNKLVERYVKEILEYIDYKDNLQTYYNKCLRKNPWEFTYKTIDEILNIKY